MQQVGKYQLVRKLATGGMAEVFLAKAAGPMGFEKTLVLKRILPHLAEEAAFVEMFLSEAKLAAQLTNPHVVQIFDFGEANGTYFLAMEYIDGPSLRTLIKRAAAQGLSLPLAVCARLVSHACEGLAFAHDFTDPETGQPLGLIHRDVSPDNILLSRQGAVKVVDFGIAKAAGQAHKTASGVVKGKLSYMPPEQVRAESLDRRVDVYALGVVLYELLTAHKPFEADSDVGLMRAILAQSPMPAVQFRPELPDSLRRILGRALAKDREQRYPDCHALQSDLEEFILSAGKPVTTQQVAQFIAQVTSSTEPAPATQPVAPRQGPAPSDTPVHTPPPPEAKTDVAAFDAPETVQLRKPQAVKEDAPEAPAERPTAPDIRPLPQVPRPSREVRSAQRKHVEPRRGGKWSSALVACVLIAGGAGVVAKQSCSSTPASQEPVPLAQVVPLPTPPPPDEPLAGTEPSDEPSSGSSTLTTGAAGVRPQDAGTVPGGAAQAPVAPPPDAGPPQGPAPVPDTSNSPKDRPPVDGKPNRPPKSVAKGKIEFRVRPYAEVYLSGAYLGDTPLEPVELSPGNYTVTLVNKKISKTVTRSIRVVSGETTVFRINLQEE